VEAHNDHGMRYNPHEDYILTVNDDCIILRQSYATPIVQDGRDGDVIVRWRLADIRKLKCESVSNGTADLITLVAAGSVMSVLIGLVHFMHGKMNENK